MKRRNFDITLDNVKIARCHTWNARHDRIVAHLKTLGGTWSRASATSEQTGSRGYTHGTVTWLSNDGRTAVFTITEVVA